MNFTKDQEQLLSQIRHDLKNTLSTVKMSTYIISKKIRDKEFEEVDRHIKKIDDKVDELVASIDNLLKSK